MEDTEGLHLSSTHPSQTTTRRIRGSSSFTVNANSCRPQGYGPPPQAGYGYQQPPPPQGPYGYSHVSRKIQMGEI
jgi:hypothetical protein